MTQPSLLIFYGQRMTGFTAALRSVTSVALYLRVPEKQSNACFLGKRSYKALWLASKALHNFAFWDKGVERHCGLQAKLCIACCYFAFQRRGSGPEAAVDARRPVRLSYAGSSLFRRTLSCAPYKSSHLNRIYQRLWSNKVSLL